MTGRPLPTDFQRHQLVALMAGIFAVGSEELVVAPLLAGIAHDLVSSIAAAGTSVAVYGVATAFGALLFAFLGDRLGRRVCLLAASGFFVAGTIVCATASTLPVFLVGRGAAGFATGVFVPAAYTFVGDQVPFERRARTMGIVVSAWSLSLVLGVPAGALIGGTFGWRSVFWILAALGTLVALLLCLQQSRRTNNRVIELSPGDTGTWNARVAVRSMPRLAVLICLISTTFLNMFAFYGMYTYIGAAFDEYFNSNAWIVAGMILSYGIGFATASFTGRWSERFGEIRSLIVMLATLPIVLLVLPSAMTHIAVLAPTMLIWGAMQGVVVTLLSTVLTEVLPGRRAATMAIYSLAVNLAVAAGAAALGPVFEMGGLRVLALCCAGITLLGALTLVSLALGQRLRARGRAVISGEGA